MGGAGERDDDVEDITLKIHVGFIVILTPPAAPRSHWKT